MIQKFTKDEIEKFFGYSESWAKRASCPRASVGCTIVSSNGIVICGGYNGAPDSSDSCLAVGCLIEGGHCVRSVHAEVRAVAYAARRGYRLDGTTAIVTLLPCINCLQAMALAGVQTVYYDQTYEREEKEHLFVLAEQLRVEFVERNRL